MDIFTSISFAFVACLSAFAWRHGRETNDTDEMTMAGFIGGFSLLLAIFTAGNFQL